VRGCRRANPGALPTSAVVGFLVEGVAVEGAHPAFVAAGDAAHHDDVAAAGGEGGGAVAGIPVDVDGAGEPGVLGAAGLGEERPRFASGLAHASIQTWYRLLRAGQLVTRGPQDA
jgi:hypothetical protein